jgi:hypothetical protein
MQSYIESVDSILDVRTIQIFKERNGQKQPFRKKERCFLFPKWWSQAGSNRRPPACKAGALPAELWPRCVYLKCGRPRCPKIVQVVRSPTRRIHQHARGGDRTRCAILVGLGRFELPTSPLSGVRSNQLSYRPESVTQQVRSNRRAKLPDKARNQLWKISNL